MSNEELERKMAFIVEQQAHFVSDIQQLREAQTQTDQVVGSDRGDCGSACERNA